MKNILFKVSLLVCCAMVLISCNQINKSRNLKLAHSLNESHPVHLGMMEMARVLKKVSEGKMTLDIYANGQLGQERDLLELLQIGTLDMTKVSAGSIENFVPEFKVLTMPYLFRDSLHEAQVLHGEIGKRLLAKGEDYWLRGLCYYDAGSRSFYSKKKPILSPEDLAGLKVRVMNSQSAFEMIDALGGSPTPVSFGELYTALQQGVVDAAENNAPSFYTSRHYEVCKYYSIDQHTTIPDVLVVSTYVWNDLSDQEKEWLQTATDQSVIYQKKVWAEAVQHSLAEVQKAGVKIFYPEKALFEAQVASLYENYKSSPDLYSLIVEIKRTGLTNYSKPLAK